MTMDTHSPVQPELQHFPFLDDPNVDAEQYLAQQAESIDMMANSVAEFVNDFFEVHAALRHMSADDQDELYRGLAIMMANCYGKGVQIGMGVQTQLDAEQAKVRSAAKKGVHTRLPRQVSRAKGALAAAEVRRAKALSGAHRPTREGLQRTAAHGR